MLEFKKLTIEDVETIRPYFQKKSNRLCDGTIGGVVMWRNYFNTQFAIYEDSLFFKVTYMTNTSFTIPYTDNIQKALLVIQQYCMDREIPLIFCTVSKNDATALKQISDNVILCAERDWFDYLYASEDLVSFAGRKYSGQRNHMNKFKKTYGEYRFTPITEDVKEQVKDFFVQFITENNKDSDTFQEEKTKVLEVLELYSTYDLLGGVLWIKDEIIAFSIGEIIHDTLYIHIEKANTQYQGAYQMIVNEFAKFYVNEDVLYINREEDVGDLGLRTSKLSYHPVDLLEKYTVKIG